jgi:hypothetical protein
MWIVELEGGRIRKVDTKGILHQEGGDGSASDKGDGGPLSMATFNGMHNCAVTPNGDLYIGDSWNHCIRLSHPHGVTWERGFLYVVDMGNNRILRLKP